MKIESKEDLVTIKYDKINLTIDENVIGDKANNIGESIYLTSHNGINAWSLLLSIQH